MFHLLFHEILTYKLKNEWKIFDYDLNSWRIKIKRQDKTNLKTIEFVLNPSNHEYRVEMFISNLIDLNLPKQMWLDREKTRKYPGFHHTLTFENNVYLEKHFSFPKDLTDDAKLKIDKDIDTIFSEAGKWLSEAEKEIKNE